jgi:hypothetical protein
MSDKRQKNQLVLAFTEEGRSEAPKASQEGTESRTAKCETERPASDEQLMEEVCERENCWQAYKRVQANQGSPGIDGMKVGELAGYLKQHWPSTLVDLEAIRLLRFRRPHPLVKAVCGDQAPAGFQRIAECGLCGRCFRPCVDHLGRD